jgi:hypothetical protein
MIRTWTATAKNVTRHAQRGAATPTVTAARGNRAEAEAVLRDMALVLHLTRALKESLIREGRAATRN